MPLNRHFVSAASSLKADEMSLLQRMARLNPPLCHLGLPLLWLP